MIEPRTRPGIAPEPKEAEVVRLIFKLYLEGYGLESVALQLEGRGIPSPSGRQRWYPGIVSRILKNPVHAGLIAHEGHWLQGVHYEQRLIEQKQYFEVQERFARYGSLQHHTSICGKAPLARLLWCAECGSRMAVCHSSDRAVGYRCLATRQRRQCSSKPYVRSEYLHPAVLKVLFELGASPAVIIRARDEALVLLEQQRASGDDDGARIHRELKELEQREERSARDFSTGLMHEELWTKTAEALRLERERIESRLAQLEVLASHGRGPDDEFAEVEALLGDLPRLWEEAGPERKRALCEKLIERIEVGQAAGKLHIVLRLKQLQPVEFSLPVGKQWRRAHSPETRGGLSRRELAYLARVAEGYSDRQIAGLFSVGRETVNCYRLRVYKVLGIRDRAEAARLAAAQIEEWRELLPLEGRCQKATRPPRVLAGSLLATLKAVAAGYSAREEALALGCPKSTIEGRRSWVLKKLEATSMEQAIAKALDLGVIRPEEPSVELVLHACKQLVGEEGRALREHHGLGEPTPLQLSYLELTRQGLSGPKIAKRYKVSQVAANATLRRLWKTLGADNLKTALERIQQLGLPTAISDAITGAESNA